MVVKRLKKSRNMENGIIVKNVKKKLIEGIKSQSAISSGKADKVFSIPHNFPDDIQK